jgi:hypothetical protein
VLLFTEPLAVVTRAVERSAGRETAASSAPGPSPSSFCARVAARCWSSGGRTPAEPALSWARLDGCRAGDPVPTARGVVVAGEVGRIFVTSSPNKLVIVDSESLAVIGRVDTGAGPAGVGWDPIHRIVGVSDQRDGAVSLLAEGRIRVDALLTHRFPLAEIDAALAAHRDPASIKVAVFPDGSSG